MSLSSVLGGERMEKYPKELKHRKTLSTLFCPPPARHVWPKKKLLNKQRQELKRVCCISPDDGQLGGNEKEIFYERSGIARRPIVVLSRKISQIIYGWSSQKRKNISNFSLVRCKLATVRGCEKGLFAFCCIEFLVNFTLFYWRWFH